MKQTAQENKQSPAAMIAEAEKMLEAVPKNKRDLVTGIMVGMELAEQTVKTA